MDIVQKFIECDLLIYDLLEKLLYATPCRVCNTQDGKDEYLCGEVFLRRWVFTSWSWVRLA